ncbi:hypothetical protein P5673_008222 [Acropora cervicornis]|uniref:Uncharacterized protein n=1 Tax=Acropora cervicornis TaxID=6130 RepID=A0AAD9QU34_ACRCE|nr:hypothetical protein P5673_008215 [Acropora cervicornis]KAK2567408.1 hypothetical protein P5673_008218 [Acropora cervicornis]KAK2567412.1 hypothetical protein P5673_008222 [Acropora cervicornis]
MDGNRGKTVSQYHHDCERHPQAQVRNDHNQADLGQFHFLSHARCTEDGPKMRRVLSNIAGYSVKAVKNDAE